jgi:hypothetical protein
MQKLEEFCETHSQGYTRDFLDTGHTRLKYKIKIAIELKLEWLQFLKNFSGSGPMDKNLEVLENAGTN